MSTSDIDCTGPHTWMMFPRRGTKTCGSCGATSGMDDADRAFMDRIGDYIEDLLAADREMGRA